MSLRKLLPAVLVFVGFLVPGDRSEGQSGCPHEPSPGDEDLTLIIRKNGGTCTADAGTYVKRSISYKIHTVASATGQCQTMLICSFGEGCTCKPGVLQYRGVAGVGNSETNAHPLSPFSIGPIYPSSGTHVQLMDSQVPGTTVPEGRNWTPFYVGNSTITQWSSIYTTACNLTPNSVVVQRPLVVVNCLPRWNLQNDEIDRFPLPLNDQTPLRIGYPAAIEADVQAAANGWRDRLAAAGLNITLQFLPDGACTGAQCILIEPGLHPTNPLTCSWNIAGYGPGAEYTVPSRIRLRQYEYADWNSAPRRTMLSHELGHLFGLEELNDTCAQSASDMHPDPTPEWNTVGTMPPLATDTDALPVANTVYGGGSRNVCG